MLKELLIFIKYPYTAGIIGTLWLASAMLITIRQDLNAVLVVVINTFATLIIAAIGFGGKAN
jgi:hypothetical protein